MKKFIFDAYAFVYGWVAVTWPLILMTIAFTLIAIFGVPDTGVKP